jgi:hypothetical protein
MPTQSTKKRASSKRATAKQPARRKQAIGSRGKRATKSGKKWSARVMRTSDAMDLQNGVFKQRSAKQIALSLKRSAEASRRRKAGPYQSAMSMLNFEINRAGKGLTADRRRVLNNAKAELRKAFNRPPA